MHRAIVVIIFSVSFACGQTPEVPLHAELLSLDALVTRSDIIVVATEKTEETGISETVRWPKREGIQTAKLVRVSLQIDEWIKGSNPSLLLTAYYWTPERFTVAGSVHVPRSGLRSIHYLRTDGKIVRYTTDLVPSSTVLPFRQNFRTGPGGQKPEIRISQLLLSPPDALDPRFVAFLPQAIEESVQLAGFMGTLPYLTALLSNSNSDIRLKTCQAMVDFAFYGQLNCVRTLLADQTGPERVPALSSLQRRQQVFETAFKRSFEANPAKTAASYAVLEGQKGIRDVLELAARSSDPQIVRLANAELSLLPPQ